MGITINARHPTDTKIKQSQLAATVFALSKASLFEEGNDEYTETTVDVKADVVSRRESTERHSIVFIAAGKDGGRNTSHESAGKQDHTRQDGVAVSEQ